MPGNPQCQARQLYFSWVGNKPALSALPRGQTGAHLVASAFAGVKLVHAAGVLQAIAAHRR